MRKLKVPLVALALVGASSLTVAMETVTYNGAQYRCDNSCLVANGTVRDSLGGSVTRFELAYDGEGPIAP